MGGWRSDASAFPLHSVGREDVSQPVCTGVRSCWQPSCTHESKTAPGPSRTDDASSRWLSCLFWGTSYTTITAPLPMSWSSLTESTVTYFFHHPFNILLDWAVFVNTPWPFLRRIFYFPDLGRRCSGRIQLTFIHNIDDSYTRDSSRAGSEYSIRLCAFMKIKESLTASTVQRVRSAFHVHQGNTFLCPKQLAQLQCSDGVYKHVKQEFQEGEEAR